MRRFRDYPISRKLIVIFCVVAAVALVIAVTSLALGVWVNERKRAVNELHTTAALIGANSNAALVFSDPQAAVETLATLGALDYIVFAALYDREGKEFARYLSDKDTQFIFRGVPEIDSIDGRYVTVTEPVTLDGAKIGTVVLRATLANRWELLRYNMLATAGILLVSFAVAMLFAMALSRSITRPLTRLSEIMRRVSSDHDYSIRTNIRQEDEVGVLARGIDDMLARAEERDVALEQHRKELEEEVARRTEALRTANEKLKVELATREDAEQELQYAHRALEVHHRDLALLSEMNDRLQVCHSVAETSPVVAHYARKLFKGCTGGLYEFNASRSLVEPVVLWGTPAPVDDVFTQDDCWALRQGRPHLVNDPDNDLICPHCAGEIDGPYLCIPMIAYGDVMGVLHLRIHPDAQEEQAQDPVESMRQLAVTASEHFGLALANLRLREVLQAQSVRDPLTSLFNRRYMKESLEREKFRCDRNRTTLGIIMLDIDHFKRFNDTYGHEAGDIVLHELGGFLTRVIRGEDIACRYGGEEFILILPGIDQDNIKMRATEILQGVKAISVQYKGQPLPGLTVSLGLAIYPSHGNDMEQLVDIADAALYAAKEQGRDRFVMASAANGAASRSLSLASDGRE